MSELGHGNSAFLTLITLSGCFSQEDAAYLFFT